MKLTVTGRHIEITEGIEQHLHDKMEKTIKDFEEHADIHIALFVEKHRHTAEIVFKAKGYTLHSKDETDDLYAAIDGALLKLEKQLRKHRERFKDMKKKKGNRRKETLGD